MILLESTVQEVNGLSWSPDGKLLAVVGKASYVELWDMETRRARRVLDTWGQHRAAFFVEGHVVSAASRGWACYYRLPTAPTVSQRWATAWRHAAGSGGHAVFAGLARWVPLLLGLSILDFGNLWESDCRRGAARYEPLQVCACPGGLLAVGTYFDCFLIEAATGKFVRKLGDHAVGAPALAASPDGSCLAVTAGAEVRLLPLGRTTRRPRSRSGRKHLTDLAFHPAGKLLLASSADGSVRLLDLGLKETAAFNWEIGPVRRVAFAPDGMRAVAVGQSGRIVVWDVDA